ncbi:hypothetical protein HMPREF9333_01444 [Johnsonella ignava ATCC 51276]|uniref:Putative Se/S carrier protein-like domain-containing protein n=1 Tax=Johnsonella ignava ATCC 51276 TaxID=679200 RepID=G5GIQ4_9FIRM|nr:DUF3343 domain-containing protein [Johnsonella ignava]EHI55308.1 hypothetical protein HMPREF9333_01444 [Johnsonella ignava ATCC 51276]
MREKKLRIVVVFNTTTDAMAAEVCLKKHKVEGRLIPLPSEISAGCGMSWSSPPDLSEEIEEILKTEGIRYENIYTVYM